MKLSQRLSLLSSYLLACPWQRQVTTVLLSPSSPVLDKETATPHPQHFLSNCRWFCYIVKNPAAGIAVVRYCDNDLLLRYLFFLRLTPRTTSSSDPWIYLLEKHLGWTGQTKSEIRERKVRTGQQKRHDRKGQPGLDIQNASCQERTVRSRETKKEGHYRAIGPGN